jgi:hypothetical protein
MSKKGTAVLQDAEAGFFSPERSQAVSAWMEIAKYFSPSQYPLFASNGYLTTAQSAGVSQLYTNEGVLSAQTLSSTIQNTVINEATEWIIPKYTLPELNLDGEANIFAERTGKLLLSSLSNSNFYTESAKLVRSFCTFGTGVIVFDELTNENSDSFGGFNFRGLHLTQCAWYEGAEGLVDRVYIKESLSVENILSRYGALSDDMAKVHKKNPTERFNIVTAQLPVGKGIFELVTVAVATRTILRSVELKEQAVFVPRWSTMSGECIGYGCGHVGVPDVKVLNTMRFEHLQSKALVNRPPVLVEQDNILGELSLQAGAMSYVNSVDGIRPVNLGINPQSMMGTEADYKDAVRRAFLLDKIALPPRTEIGEMSAYEVAHRLSEMGNVVAGEISRLYSEFLSLVGSRGIGILFRKGMLGEIPKAVQEYGSIDFNFMFVNPLARSRELEGVKSLQSALQVLTAVQNASPNSPELSNVMQVFNTERMPINVCRDLGVPDLYLSTEEEIRQAEQEQQQENQLRKVAQLQGLESQQGGGQPNGG